MIFKHFQSGNLPPIIRRPRDKFSTQNCPKQNFCQYFPLDLDQPISKPEFKNSSFFSLHQIWTENEKSAIREADMMIKMAENKQ